MLPQDVFGSGGLLSRVQPGFEPRAQQQAMAAEVAGALEAGESLLVEAGTGVGKSLAYLLPAALWAAKTDKRVLVATHTRALQSQLVDNDLPVAQRVARQLGIELRYGVLMGAANYLCVQRLHSLSAKSPELFADEEASKLRELALWSESGQTGLRRAVPYHGPEALWEQICRDSDVCQGRRGPFWDRCLYRKDIDRARRCHVLVVNHKLLLSQAALPEAHAIIVDEAHCLESAVDDGPQVSLQQARRLITGLFNPKTGKGFARRLRRANDAWRARLRGTLESCDESSSRLFEDLCRALGIGPKRMAKRVVRPPAVKNDLGRNFGMLVALLRDSAGLCDSSEEERELSRHVRLCSEFETSSASLLSLAYPDHAYWVEATARNRAFRAAPLDSAIILQEHWKHFDCPILLTSATLAEGSDLVRSARGLGIGHARGRVIGSPFDYRSRVAVVVDRTMPDPNDAGFAEAAVERCVTLSRLIPGGILVLSPSFRLMRAIHSGLESAGLARPVFCQGQEDPGDLIRRFRRAGNGVLVGTSTFWQGVDVPGTALACVVIAKLQFDSPDNPLEEARMERIERLGGKAFADYMLPRAITRFRQGFGRLMRHRDDYGAVVVLDRRLAEMSYGRRFFSALPACARLDKLDDLDAFVRRFQVSAPTATSELAS